MSCFHSAGVQPSSTWRTEHCAGSEMLQPTASAEPRLGYALSLAATYPSRTRSFFSSKWKGKDSQLCLAQRTVLGQQAHAELPLDACKPVFAPQSSGSPLSFTARTAPADRGALCTCLPTSKYQRQAYSLAGSEEADRRVAQKKVPGRKDDLPFSCSLPESWCCVESLGQRKATPASVSLQTQFAERELHG